jgi:hypothetical protein
MGNAFMTNWMRDKGYGMGATVGYIPCIGGANVELSPHGNVFDVDDRTRKRWRGWFRFVYVDQWLVFAVGSIAGMFMTTLMAVEFVTPGSAGSGWAIAGLQANAIAERAGPVFWYLTLLTGFWVLFKTQLGNSEGLVRALTDMLWSGSPAVRRWRGGDVRAVYYGVMIVFIVWGCIALNLAQPLTLVIISANIAAANLVLLSVHTLVLNRKMLPAELRAPFWRQGMLVVCAVFFGSFAIATIMSRLGG